MPDRKIATREQWLVARLKHLRREKEFTRLRDELAHERRALPWVRIDKDYRFDTTTGPASLAQLFGTRSQLIVYHFMYGPDWAEGCPSCSFWADNFDGIGVHLAQRDIALIAVSRAPLATLAAYAKRMGWSFPWVSSLGSDFNADFGVSFSAEERDQGRASYNYGANRQPPLEAPGVSVFARDRAEVFHTYSTYGRGLDMLNGAYHFMDLAPKGRDEAALPYPMQWVRRHDQYGDAAR
ncbi:MAG: DUF899 domain-containing protein [Burkholderiales bacterium]